MERTTEEIKLAIATGKISAITVDTSVFDCNGNRFEGGLLARLSQFKTTEVSFVLSDVVVGEVLTHVAREAADAQSKTATALKEVGKSWQVGNERCDEILTLLFGNESPDALAARRFKKFVEAVGAFEIKSGPLVAVDQLLESYFSSKPPFGKSGQKKNEFPDAIALLALESWASKRGTVLLAVSKDADWKKFAKNSASIVVVDDLAEALGLFHQNANVACVRLMDRLNRDELDVTDQVRAAIENEVDRSVFIPKIDSEYIYDADVYDPVVKNLKLDRVAFFDGAFRVVDKPSETEIVVEAQVEVEIEVSADVIFTTIDSTDRDAVFIGSASPRATTCQTFDVLLDVLRAISPADAELTDAITDCP